MELNKVFMHNLKKWRKVEGISQEKLAERCHSAHSYIRQIECGIRYPSFAFIERLANALNIAPYQLFYDASTVQGDLLRQLEKIHTIETDLFEVISHDIHDAFEKLKE
jgi:transcriptional regulator with XRE-family HTH domain